MPFTAEAENSQPCSELFIYYLEGSLQEDPSELKHFIGNWQEDGFSFLFFTHPSLDQVQDLLRVSPLLRLMGARRNLAYILGHKELVHHADQMLGITGLDPCQRGRVSQIRR